MAAAPGTRRFPFPLPNGWYQVAYSDEVPVGEVKPLRYFATELVAFRGEDGEAHVLDAYCPHLGAHLGHGARVVGDRIRCPFHALEFAGSGRCARIPYAKRIPPRAEIRSWRVCEKNGMVLVHFDKQGRPPAFCSAHGCRSSLSKHRRGAHRDVMALCPGRRAGEPETAL